MRALRLALALRPGEGPVVALAFGCFFSLLSATYVLRPVRDALGIEGGVHTYQWLFTGTFVATLVLYPLFGAIAARTRRTWFAGTILLLVIASLVAFRGLLAAGVAPVWVARAFFVWASVFNVLVVSIFWGVMADVLGNEAGRRTFGFIAGGGTAGALLGPVLTRTLVAAIGVEGLLLVSAGLLALALGCVVGIDRAARALPAARDAAPRDRRIGGDVLGGLRRVRRSRYLLGICGYVLLLTTTATFAYFQQGTIIEAALPDRAGRTELFATIDLLVNGLALLVQLLLTRRFIARLGVPVVLALLPLTTAAGFGALAIAPVLLILVVFQVVRRATDYALAKPARELLFTVVPREDKFKAKNVIDVVVYRGGDAAAAWLNAGLMAAGLGVAATAAIAIPISLTWAAVGFGLGRKQERRRAAPPPSTGESSP